MLKVIIDDQSVNNLNVREGEKNGRKWRMANQKAWIYKPGALFPELFEITLPDGAFAYPAGEYQLDLEALLTQGSYKSLSLDMRGGVVLLPVQVAEPAVATEQPEPKTEQPSPLFRSSRTATA